MLKNGKVVLFVTLKSWSGRKLSDPTTYESEGSDLGLTGGLPRNLRKVTKNNHEISRKIAGRWAEISNRKLVK